MNKSAPKVFISYSHSSESKQWVRRFATALVKRGVLVWMDEFELRPGQELRGAIEKGLRQSDVIVFVITPEKLQSPNLFFELGAAVGMNKPIVAIVSKRVDRSTLPQSIRVRKFIVQGLPEKTASDVQAVLNVPNFGNYAE